MYAYVHQKACPWMPRERLFVITIGKTTILFMNVVMDKYNILYNKIYRIKIN